MSHDPPFRHTSLDTYRYVRAAPLPTVTWSAPPDYSFRRLYRAESSALTPHERLACAVLRWLWIRGVDQADAIRRQIYRNAFMGDL